LALLVRGHERLKTRLRPSVSTALPGVPRLASWGQVFVQAPASALLGERDDSPVANITCWGDGRINFQRAAPEALEERLRGVVGTQIAGQIISLRREVPGIGVDGVLERLDLDSVRRSNLRGVLTSQSECHGMWLVMTSVRTGAMRYEMFVDDRRALPAPRQYVFCW
jgi:hypothetical protein